MPLQLASSLLFLLTKTSVYQYYCRYYYSRCCITISVSLCIRTYFCGTGSWKLEPLSRSAGLLVGDVKLAVTLHGEAQPFLKSASVVGREQI